ncbi:MAG TPA: hypothetical protein PLJ38_06745, partial [bacterium]|nr:hypothetical protein [bacterium]
MALPKKINIITGAIFYLVRKSQILKFKIFKKLFSYFYFFLKQKLECPYYSIDFANRYYYLFQNNNIIDTDTH